MKEQNLPEYFSSGKACEQFTIGFIFVSPSETLFSLKRNFCFKGKKQKFQPSGTKVSTGGTKMKLSFNEFS